MKRVLGFVTLLSSALLLAGCPIYPSDACADDSDCPGGFVCNGYSNTCVQLPNGTGGTAGSAGSAGSSSYCSAPSDCAVNETCGIDALCFPGDCTMWGCVSGYVCDVSTGYAICVSESTGGAGGGGAGGSSGAGGTGGTAGTAGTGGTGGTAGTGGGGAAGTGGTAGSGATGGTAGAGGVSGAGGTGAAGSAGAGGTGAAGSAGAGGTGAAGAGGTGGSSGSAGSGGTGGSAPTCGGDGLSSATGIFQLVDGSTTLACLGGLETTLGESFDVAGVSDSIDWRFSLFHATTSTGTINCNENGVICTFQFQQTTGQTTTTYSATGTYTIQVGGWDATSFVGTVSGLSALKTTSVPGGSQSVVVDNLLLVINGSKN